MLENFENSDFTCCPFHQKLLAPLVARIENHLRLVSHAHLDLDQNDVFKTQIIDNRPLIAMEPVHVFHKVIDIKGYLALGCFLF